MGPEGEGEVRLLLFLGETFQDSSVVPWYIMSGYISRQGYLFLNDFWNSIVKLDKMLYSTGRTNGNGF